MKKTMKKTMTTTLNEIKKYQPCKDGWKKLLKTLHKTKADDEPLSFETILNSNGIEDAVWCLRVLPFEDQRHFMADVAESVLRFFEDRFPGDDRPRKAIETVRAEPLDPAACAAARTAYDGDASTPACTAYDATGCTGTEAGGYDAAYAAACTAYEAADYDAAADAHNATYADYDAATCASYAVYAADSAHNAATTAAYKDKWSEIEAIFKKYYC